MVFDRGRTRVYDLATEAGQDAASDDAVKTGRRRTHGRSAPCALGFWHPAAQAAPALRGALARQLSRQWSGADPRGWFCALEYLAVAPDLGWLAGPIAAIQASLAGDDARAALRFRADEPPKWPRKGWEALPIALPPSPTLAEVAQLAAERLAAEQATAPASEPLH